MTDTPCVFPSRAKLERSSAQCSSARYPHMDFTPMGSSSIRPKADHPSVPYLLFHLRGCFCAPLVSPDAQHGYTDPTARPILHDGSRSREVGSLSHTHWPPPPTHTHGPHVCSLQHPHIDVFLPPHLISPAHRVTIQLRGVWVARAMHEDVSMFRTK